MVGLGLEVESLESVVFCVGSLLVVPVVLFLAVMVVSLACVWNGSPSGSKKWLVSFVEQMLVSSPGLVLRLASSSSSSSRMAKALLSCGGEAVWLVSSLWKGGRWCRWSWSRMGESRSDAMMTTRRQCNILWYACPTMRRQQ